MLDFKKSAKSEPTTSRKETRLVKENPLKIQRYFEVVHEAEQNAQFQAKFIHYFSQKQIHEYLKFIFLTDFYNCSANSVFSTFKRLFNKIIFI
jgi:hypothetical protein